MSMSGKMDVATNDGVSTIQTPSLRRSAVCYKRKVRKLLKKPATEIAERRTKPT